MVTYFKIYRITNYIQSVYNSNASVFYLLLFNANVS